MRATLLTPLRRLSKLSARRQRLVRLCQAMNYGQIIGLPIRDGEPIFDPEPTVLLDVKLDGDACGRTEAELPDFDLCQEFCRLLDLLDELQNGVLERVEVRAGLPRRAVVQRRLAEVER